VAHRMRSPEKVFSATAFTTPFSIAHSDQVGGCAMLVIVAVVVGIFLALWVRRHLRFRASLSMAANVMLLEQNLSMLLARARTELSGEQLNALNAELREIKDAEGYMVSRGASSWEARHVVLQGAVTSVANHLDLNELLPG
jgi:hypothetical protein